jgi:hypothetical protein
MLGLEALDCCETATQEGSPRRYADPKESTIIDARYVERFTFCRHVLLQCAALSAMQVIVADSTFECSQSGLDGRPRLPLPHRGDWEHRTASRFWDRSPVQP